MYPIGYAYSRDCLLSAYSPASPTFSVRQRIRELGLWNICHLFDSRRRGIAYARSYRSCRADCCRPVPTFTPVGNGAYTVTSLSRRRRSISCSQPRTLTYLRDCSSSDVRNSSSSGNRMVIASLNVRSLSNKVDDLLEVRRDRSIDVLCLVETWHDTDAVCFRRLRSDGFQVTDRPRPWSAGESSSLSTNHGGVAVVAVPGVHLSSFKAVSNPTSFELLCTV